MAGYREIAVQLEEDIHAGAYGERLPTIDKLSERFAVSRVTMQRAIRVLKEKKLITASPRRGIRVTRLKRPRTHVLGAVLGVAGGWPLHDQLIRGMHYEAGKHDEIVALGPGTNNDPGLELEQVKMMVDKQRVDGVILWPSLFARERSPAVIYLQERDIPFVIVPEDDPGYADCNTVSSVDSTGAAQVMTHLLGIGQRSIAFVQTPETAGAIFTKQRFEAYQQAMRLAGLKPTTIVLDGKTGVRALGRCSAVFCVTDAVALAVVKLCLRAGIRIPKDLAVVGYDNTATARDLDLTSVEQHFETIGALAVDLLLRDVEGELAEKEHLHVESELVIRGSTREVNR